MAPGGDGSAAAAARAGARAGAHWWAVYAVAEFAVAAVVPWLRAEGHEVRPLHAGFSALLLVLLPLAGAAGTAALQTLGTRVWRRLPAGATAAAGLALVFGAHLAVRGAWPRPRQAAALALAFAATAGAVFAARRLAPRAGRLVLPALVLACMIVAPFLRQTPWRSPDADAPRPSAAGRPNVLLVVLDTVRADHLSVYGYERETTPNLEAFAREAVVYERAVAPSDVTLTSHASLFTGLYGRRHGARYGDADFPEGRPLAARFTTLAEILRAHGWRTEAVVANHGFLSPAFGLAQGFDVFDYRLPVPPLAEGEPWLLRRAVRDALARVAPRAWSETVFRDAATITREAETRLEHLASGGRPWLLVLNTMDAHDPYLPPPPWDTRWPGKDPDFRLGTYYALARDVMQLRREVTERERDHLVSQYDGAIAFTDDQLGRLFARMKSLGVWDDTLVVITSDHGEAFGRRHLVGHVVGVHQDQVHVPLLVHYPAGAAVENGTSRDALASGVDVLPTVLDVAGLPAPPDLDGRSLVGAAEEPDDASRLVVAESYPERYRVRWHERFDRVERAAFRGWAKLVWSSRGERELYDLSRDPDEEHDLAARPDARRRAAELERALLAWSERTAPAADAPTDVERVDRDAVERLRALGYVE